MNEIAEHYELIADKKFRMVDPTFKHLTKLKSLGLDLQNAEELSGFYLKVIDDAETRNDVIEILFGEKIESNEIDDVKPGVLKEAFLDFLAIFGLHTI